MLTSYIQSRPANRPLIAIVWLLTFLPWMLPFHAQGALLLSALCTLTSNVLALVLLFSPNLTDRLNGLGRLVLQFLILVIGAVILFRSGVTLDSLYHVVTHSGS